MPLPCVMWSIIFILVWNNPLITNADSKGCDAGYYGPDCTGVCGHCNGQCSQTDGICTDGCESGWSGPKCDSEDGLSTGEIVLIVVGAVLVTGVLLLMIVTIYIMKKRSEILANSQRQGETMSEDEDGTERPRKWIVPPDDRDNVFIPTPINIDDFLNDDMISGPQSRIGINISRE